MSPQGERAPLLQQRWSEEGEPRTHLRIEDLSNEENPREWVRWRKMANVAVIALMSILSPLVSSMFTPGIAQIADDLDCSPLFGGIIVQRLGWRWIFWIMTIVCFVNTLAGYFFLRETYAPLILSSKKAEFESQSSEFDGTKYSYEGEDTRPLKEKLAQALKRPPKIFAQPIVAVMAVYQALIFGTTYSIYTNMQPIYQDDYGFSTEKVGLLYLGPGLGFLFAVWFLVPRIDTVYKTLTAKNHEKARPEFRLPLANIGSVFIPVSLFWFAWAVEKHTHWFASISATFFYGIGQVMILNSTQNYFIDSFEKYAASAIAAGTVFRSVVGGIIPIFAPMLFEKIGYGWGISTFAFVSLVLAPAPVLFFIFGERLRERFPVDL
ncbi:uncharacterized protein ALTATR162_LOCUS7651 [Alternaria atra]|uniref:Major facilitator superfamily (MFS) profile domain-containing protein n=1 Tax=Alternaria atra TaxID=119953 RepID=A0A8J2I4C9_9PLEO|nr:uncharacterized protein ALTATR162_LOCUS7651 [Alternaria atra]CAG5173574.1 unnamed protein product [Alternaria atra]